MISKLAGHKARLSGGHRALALCMAVGMSAMGSTALGDQIKANNALSLNDPASWVGNAVPVGELAIFDATLTSQFTFSLGDDLQSWLGIRLTSPGAGVTISAGNTLSLGTGGIDMANATQSLTLANNLLLTGTQSWNTATSLLVSGNVDNGGFDVILDGLGSKTISGSMTGTGGLTKLTASTLTLTGTNTNAGNTTIRHGKLVLDFTAAGSPAADILFNGGSIVLGGNTASGLSRATFEMNGTGNTQTLAAIAITSGINRIAVADGNTLTLGALTKNGGSNLTTAGGFVEIASTGTILLPTPNLPIFLDSGNNAFATYGLYDWAGTDSNGKISAATYTQVNTSQGATNISAVDVIGSFTQAGNGQWRGVRFAEAGGNTVTLGGGTTHGMGGILVTPDSTGVLITGATLRVDRTGTGGAYMNVQQNSTQGLLTISSAIADASSGTPVSIVKNGVGTLVLTANSGYTAGVSIFEGVVSVTQNGALGNGGPVHLAGGTLEARGNFTSTHAVTVHSAGGTIAVTSSNAMTISAAIGGAGPLTKSGPGGLTLSSTNNTFSGGITVAQGSLIVTNASGSGTGTGAVVIQSGATLGGTGTIAGPITVLSGGKIAPGNNNVGVLNVNALTLNSGSILDFDFPIVGTGDSINILNGAALTLGTGIGINLFQAGGSVPFNISGTYNIFTGATNLVGAASNLSVLNPVGAASYAFNVVGSNIVLTISGGPTFGAWAFNGGGSWGVPGNWTGGTPNAPGDIANFAAGFTGPGSATITLDGTRTVGNLLFNNTAGSYEIASGSGGSLVMNNGGNPAGINVTGAHRISAPLQLDASTTVTTNGTADSLTITSPVTGAGVLSVSGAGATIITDTVANNVTINAGGTFQIGNGGTTGVLNGLLTNNGTLRFNRSDAVTFTSSATTGSLAQAGTGTLTLVTATGTTSYSGTTTVTAGVLRLAPGAVIGTGPLVVSALLDLNGNNAGVGTLSGAATGVIDNTSAGGSLTLAVNQGGASTYSGAIRNTTGTISVVKSGGGALTLAGNSSFSGGTTITGGSIVAGHNNAFGTGSITVSGTGLSLNNNINLPNNIFLAGVGAGEFMSLANNANATLSGNVAGLDPNPTGGIQYRLGFASGTLTVLGTHTSLTYMNAADTNTTTTPISMITRGNVIFSGTSSLTTTASMWFGRNNGGTMNATLQGDTTVTTLVGTDYAEGANIGGNLNGGNTNTAATLTIRQNARLILGNNTESSTVGIASFNLNAMGNDTGIATLNLAGGSIVLAGFIKANDNGLSNINFNGTRLVAGLDNVGSTQAGFLPNTIGTTANVRAGGAHFDTNGHIISVDQIITSGTGLTPDGGITKWGAGTLFLTASGFTSNSYSGNTTINGGVLMLPSANEAPFIPAPLALGFGAARAPTAAPAKIIVNTGGTFDINGTPTLPNTVELAGGSLINNSATTAIVNRGIIGLNINATAPTSAFMQLTVTDDTGSGASAALVLGLTQQSLQLDFGGSGYTAAPTVTITDGGGAGATATAVLTGDVVTGITLTNPGSGYLFNPTITIAAPATTGSQASAQVIDGAYSILGYQMNQPGDNYTNPTVAFTSFNQTINATAILPSISLASATTSNVGGAGNIEVNVPLLGAGAMNKVGPGTLILRGAANFTGHTDIQGGMVQFLGGVTHASGSFGGTGALRVDAGTNLTSNGVRTTGLWTISGNHTIRAGQGTLSTSKVNVIPTIAATSRLNLTDSILIVQTTGAADKTSKINALNALITSGAGTGSSWTGTGITSTSAQGVNSTNYAVGLFDNGLLLKTSFGGQTTDPSSLIVAVARLGDSNRDGIVDINDLGNLANKWQQSGDTWDEGDFNRDGFVDINDLGILASNWQQTSIFSLAMESFGDTFSGGVSSTNVPEPASLAVLALGGAALLARRRQRK